VLDAATLAEVLADVLAEHEVAGTNKADGYFDCRCGASDLADYWFHVAGAVIAKQLDTGPPG
jgi:hypothetical protein